MPNRCVIDRKLRFEFARDLEQTIFHAFTLRHPNSERELDDKEFVKERCLATPTPLSLIRELLGGSGRSVPQSGIFSATLPSQLFKCTGSPLKR
jgi:hypothetical protein